MRSFSLTDIGKKRKMNQDFVYSSDEKVGNLPNLYIVADGMGGHNAGDCASRLTVETMIDQISSYSEKRPVALLAMASAAANTAVLEKSQSERIYEGMGTTLVAACIDDHYLYVANIGDSRLYIIDEEGIEQITRDHSLVEEMVRRGELREEDARNHPEKNVITRAIGTRKSVKADFFDVAVNDEDTILMCSDGLTNMVEDREIFSIVRHASSLEEACRKLVDTANRNGGSDNISVILVQPVADGV